MIRSLIAHATLVIALFSALSAGPVLVQETSAAVLQGDSVTIEPGSSSYSIEVGGVERSFRVFRPTQLDDPASLVVMIHGGGGSGAIAEKFYGWDALANREHFVVAYPDALGTAIPAWNTEGNCCGQSGRTGVDDVGFIVAMVDFVQQRLPIDASRIFATGISNGGMLDYTLACTTDLFAAIGPVSATMLNDCVDPAPTSVIHIHGLKDTTVPFDGSIGDGPAKIDGPPISDVIESWRRFDGCTSAVATTAGLVTTSTSNCTNGREVELITVADGEHGWPGAAQKPNGGKQPSQAIDSTATIWAFFADHPKPSD